MLRLFISQHPILFFKEKILWLILHCQERDSNKDFNKKWKILTKIVIKKKDSNQE